MPRSRCSRRNNDNEVVMEHEVDDDDDDDDEEEEVEMMFSQQAPEASQPIQPVKQSERTNLDKMGADNKEKVIVALSRLVLFKALAGEPIDRLKCWKEANADSLTSDRIATAVFDEAATNLRNVFGFELRRAPKYMETSKSFPKKFKDRHYVINEAAEEDEAAEHAKAIHSVHSESAIERGLLMVMLALAFCKGEPKPDGSRWITDSDLYRLLHGIDENIPEEPPAAANRKVTGTQARYRNDGEEGLSETPDVDGLLERFVHMDYLMKEKAGEETGPGSQVVENTFQYAMGPRASMEIGRKQVVIFCAEVLDEQPDETMIAEIDAVDDEGEFMEEEE